MARRRSDDRLGVGGHRPALPIGVSKRLGLPCGGGPAGQRYLVGIAVVNFSSSIEIIELT